MAALSISPYPALHFLFFSNSRFPSNPSLNNTQNLALALKSPLSLSTRFSEKQTPLSTKFHHQRTKVWRISASPEESLTSDTTPIDSSQQIISTSDDGTSSVISVLLSIAFIALTILTIGVVYIAVTDFLQKREGEKFDKEESAKKKKKKGKPRSRTGPRGFGQKIDDDDDL